MSRRRRRRSCLAVLRCAPVSMSVVGRAAQIHGFSFGSGQWTPRAHRREMQVKCPCAPIRPRTSLQGMNTCIPLLQTLDLCWDHCCSLGPGHRCPPGLGHRCPPRLGHRCPPAQAIPSCPAQAIPSCPAQAIPSCPVPVRSPQSTMSAVVCFRAVTESAGQALTRACRCMRNRKSVIVRR